MYDKHPGIAERWQEHTPKGAHLPEKVSFALLHKLAGMALAVPKLPNLAATPKFDIGRAIAEHVPTQAATSGSLQFSSLANRAKPPPLPNRVPVPPARVQAAAAPAAGMSAVGRMQPPGQAATVRDPSSAGQVPGIVPTPPGIVASSAGQPAPTLTAAPKGFSWPAAGESMPIGDFVASMGKSKFSSVQWKSFLTELHKEAGRFTWIKDRALDLTDKDSDTRKHISEKVHLGVNRVQHGAINAKEKAREAIHSYTEKKARYLQSPAQLATPKTRVLSAAPPNKSFAIK